MVTQYPDKLFFISGETDSVYDQSTGQWKAGSKGIIFNMDCRFEESGVYNQIKTISGETVTFNFIAYMALGNLQSATKFIVDKNNNFIELEGNRLTLFIKEFFAGLNDSVQIKCVNRLGEILGFGTISRFSLGQLNCRAWITLSKEVFSKLA